MYSQKDAFRKAEEDSKRYKSESESQAAIVSILNDPSISYQKTTQFNNDDDLEPEVTDF